MSTEPRELFPVTFMGPRNGVSRISGTVNPDPLADLPDPTPEELAALERDGELDPTITSAEADVIPDPPVDPEPDLAGATGKGQGAASKA